MAAPIRCLGAGGLPLAPRPQSSYALPPCPPYGISAKIATLTISMTRAWEA